MATAIEYGLISALLGVVVITGVTSTGAQLERISKPPYMAVKFPPRQPPREFVGWRCPAGTVPVRAEDHNNPIACVGGVSAVAVWK